MARNKTAPIQAQKYLKGIDYPISKRDLIQHARQNGADDELISMLEEMNKNEFNSPVEVSEALGE